MVLPSSGRKPGVPPRTPHSVDDLLDQHGLDIAARLTEAQANLLYPDKTTTEAALAPLTTLPSYGQELRRKGVQLAWGKAKDAHLNDRNDIDATGASDMGATISTYLAEYQAGGVRTVYSEHGSIYLVGTTINVPAHLTLQGPMRMDQGSSVAHKATFRAAADGVTMFRLAGNYAVLSGLNISLNNKANAVGVSPNGHFQLIEHCLFGGAPATSVGVKGGGILYFSMFDNIFSDGYLGRAVDLLDSYADNPAAVYYGVNVGWFERNVFGAAGGVRVEGIATFRDNDFEAAYTNPALEFATPSAVSIAVIDSNYFEISGSPNIAIRLGSGASAHIEGNAIYGSSMNTVGGIAVEAVNILYGLAILRNSFSRFETAIKEGAMTTSLSPGHIIAGNTYAQIKNMASSGYRVTQTWSDAATRTELPSAFRQESNGTTSIYGALTGGAVYIYGTSGADIDLRAGNVFALKPGTASPLGAKNPSYGQRFVVVNQSEGAITLPYATWKVREGANATMADNEIRQFFVDYNLAIREIALPKQTALTAADATAIDATWDATEQAVVENLRTRVNELESRLQALGLLS